MFHIHHLGKPDAALLSETLALVQLQLWPPQRSQLAGWLWVLQNHFPLQSQEGLRWWLAWSQA